MDANNELLQAIGQMMDSKLVAALEPINNRLDAMQADISGLKTDVFMMKEDIGEIKEHTTITRETVNDIGEWTEIASDVLKISYPLRKAE